MDILKRIRRATRYVVRGEGGPKPRAALHEAANSSRRLKNWTPTSADINTILSSSGDMLVKRARELVLTNGYATSAKEEFAAALVGAGIRPSSTAKDEALQNQVMRLWNDWMEEAESEGVVNFYGMQDIAGGALFDAGEMFVRLRSRRASDGLTVPLQLQMLETEFLDRTYNIPLANGRQIKAGIEYDTIGRRAAYWFWKEHPGDQLGFRNTGQRVRVPADRVIHVYEVGRPGQMRGFPKIIPGMIRLWLLDQYDDAELDRKKVAALVAAFITKPDEGAFWTNEEEETNDDTGLTEAIAEWEPGMVQELLPGEDIEFSNPADVGGQYESFQFRNLLAISAAIGVPYANMTGDVSRANYSSLRADMVRFKKRITRTQKKTLVFQLCRCVWAEFIDAAVLSGVLAVDRDAAQELKRRVVWIPPKWEWVDPKKDLEAEVLAKDNNFKSRSQIIIEQGGDPEEVDEQIAKDREREKKLDKASPARSPIPTSDEDEEQEYRDERERAVG